jgi:hypothetical protein
MSDEVPTPGLVGGARPTTVTQKTIRLSVIEMGDYDDALYFEKGLKRKCRLKIENISPVPAKGKSLHKVPQEWPDFRQAILDSAYSGRHPGEPHWWYWSGHHAGMGDGTYYAEAKQVGFFNEQYYKAWKKYTDDKQKTTFPSEIEGAVFMLTGATEASISRPVEYKKSNPVLGKDSHECVGMMLIGCHTLSFSSTQEVLVDEFAGIPVIFGYWEAKAPGGTRQQNSHIRHILNAPKRTKPSFFEDPESHFSVSGGAEKCISKMVGKISKRTRKRRIAVLYDYSLYIPEYSWGTRCWIHSYAMNIISTANEDIAAGVTLVTCPVPKRKSPFSYKGKDDRFIVGCSKPNTTIAGTFKWKILKAVKGFVQIDCLLAYSLDYIYRKMAAKKKQTPKILEINETGTRILLDVVDQEFMKVVIDNAPKFGYKCVRDGASAHYVLSA